jgi:SAM-dependent methyltransferase
MLKPYIKGALSFVLPQARDSHSNLFSVSAKFSYSLFLRHYVLRSRFRVPEPGETVAELGPGSSLGFGIAAVIAGASCYRAYDVAARFNTGRNLKIFDELVELFRKRAPIPHEGEFSRIFPFLDDYAFPARLTESHGAAALDPSRLAIIREDIAAGGKTFIRVDVGMTQTAGDKTFDWIASHSVMEHIDDLDGVHRFLGRALKPDGVMTHLIDFSAHGLSDQWNGHWTISELGWTILRGRRLYLINRQPLATYLALLERHGIKVVEKHLHQRVDGHLSDAFRPAFSGMSSVDARTHMAFLVCSRDANGPPSADRNPFCDRWEGHRRGAKTPMAELSEGR